MEIQLGSDLSGFSEVGPWFPAEAVSKTTVKLDFIALSHVVTK